MHSMWADYRDIHESSASVVCLGNFDGLHRGHQSIFFKTLSSAKRHHLKSYLVTFDPHPSQVLGRGQDLRFILSSEEKSSLLFSLPFDGFLIQRFDRTFSEIPAKTFVEDVLIKTLKAKIVMVGSNFRFGFEARGNVDLLSSFSSLEVKASGLVSEDGEAISSSLIRAKLNQGELTLANRLLGYFYFASGIVVHGAGRGSKIGIPTANIRLSKPLLLPTGVYCGFVENPDTGQVWKSAFNFGKRPTFDGEGLALEAHLLDFKGDLYGRSLKAHFVSQIRPEKRFEKVSELIDQVKQDIQVSRETLDVMSFTKPEDLLGNAMRGFE